MKIKDLRKKNLKDLEKEAIKLRESIAKSEVDKFGTDDKNVKKRRNLRRDLARVLTIINEDAAPEETTDADDKEEDK